jgi:hypothetical protein
MPRNAQRALLWRIVCSTGGTPRTWAGPKPTPPSSLRTATSLRTTIIFHFGLYDLAAHQLITLEALFFSPLERGLLAIRQGLPV